MVDLLSLVEVAISSYWDMRPLINWKMRLPSVRRLFMMPTSTAFFSVIVHTGNENGIT